MKALGAVAELSDQEPLYAAAAGVLATAVVLRDGFHWVFEIGPGNKVQQRKVDVGARIGDRIEVGAGLPRESRVVAQGDDHASQRAEGSGLLVR